MTINFFSQSGTPFAHLSDVASNVAAAEFDGRWATLELQPDLFVPQHFSVGVTVQASGARLHYHLLGDFKKINSLYSASLPKKFIAELIQHAEHVLSGAVRQQLAFEQVEFQSAHLYLSAPHSTAGASAEAVLERLYQELVVVDGDTRQAGKGFDSADNATVRDWVNQALKQIALNDYERIVLGGHDGVVISEGGQKHRLDVNLRIAEACGSIVSAVYKTTTPVEMNLLRASLDLSTYAKLQRLPHKGMFVVLPEQADLARADWEHIDDLVSEQSWKLERDGFRVCRHSSAVAIAQEIFNWAKPTLAVF